MCLDEFLGTAPGAPGLDSVTQFPRMRAAEAAGTGAQPGVAPATRQLLWGAHGRHPRGCSRVEAPESDKAEQLPPLLPSCLRIELHFRVSHTF